MTISPEQIQEVVIARLKGDTLLTTALAEGPSGVRESQWRGTAFEYPNVRLQRCLLSPYGNGPCADSLRRCQFTIQVSSKKDSSVTAQELQGLVMASLEGARLASADVRTLIPIRLQLQSPVSPDPLTGVWTGSVTFRTLVKAL